MEENSERKELLPKWCPQFANSQKYILDISIYCCTWQRKAANPHIWEGGT